MLEAELVVLEGHLRGTNFPLGVRSVIGRALGNEIQLVHDGISRRHCQVTVRDDGATVEDLGSTNGTKLNGVRVTTAPLYHGDKLEVGPVILEFTCLGAKNPQDTGAELAPNLAPGEDAVSLSSSRLIPLPPPGSITTETRHHEAAVLFELANFLVARRDTVTLADGLLERIRRAFKPDRAVLFDYEQAVDRIRAAHVFRGKDDPPGATVPVPEKVVTKCIRDGKVVFAAIEEVPAAGAGATEPPRPAKERTLLCAPLRVDSRTLGAIYLDRPLPGSPYVEEDAHALNSAASLAAFAIDRLYFEREARARAFELERKLQGVESERDAYLGAFLRTQDPLVVLDEEGEVSTANAAATQLLEEAQRAGAPLLATVVSPVVSEGKHVLRTKWTDGIDVTAWPIRNEAGEIAGAVARLDARKA
ncbi:MAG TPA: FHA domain-containing protein [Planctomycetota bacterium]|nr:FHA domain-containing protein [Planctomycetota bacterium]